MFSFLVNEMQMRCNVFSAIRYPWPLRTKREGYNGWLNYRIQGHFWRLICFKWLVGSSVDYKVYDLDGSSARQLIPRSLLSGSSARQSIEGILFRWLVGSSVNSYVLPPSEVFGPPKVTIIMPEDYALPFNAHTEFYIYTFTTVIEKDHLGDWSPEKDCC